MNAFIRGCFYPSCGLPFTVGPETDETIDTVMFDPNQKPDTARAENSIFGSPEADNLLPKDEFPDYAMRAEDAFQLVSDELMLDGNARQNLATFCQTWDEKQVRMLMNLSINKNMIDKDEYPQTAAIEMRCAAIIANLWNASQNEKPIGCSTIGSSEACMLGGWRPCGAGEPAGKPPANPLTSPTWYAALSKSAGTSSAAIGILKA